MPACFCASSGCADKSPQGAEVDVRTFKQHVRQDRLAKASEARAASDRAVEAQRADIAEYIGSLTLADKVSPPTGTRLWSKQAPGPTEIDEVAQRISSIDLDGAAASNPSSSYHRGSRPSPSPIQPNPSRRMKVEIILDQLAELEHNVETLSEKTKTGLESLKHMSRIIPASFPLNDLYSTSRSLCAELDAVKGKAHSVIQLKAQIESQLHPIRALLKKAKLDWSALLSGPTIPDISNGGVEHKTDHHFHPTLNGIDPIIQVSLLMVVSCNLFLHAGRKGCTWMFTILQYIIQLALMRNTPKLNQRDQKLLSDFPSDIRSARKTLNLDGKYTIYAVCPKDTCHRTYKPTFEGSSPIPIYPRYCSHRRYRNGQRCGEVLIRPRIVKGLTVQVPIKEFVSFDFKDWVGGVLSRPELETQMDAAWDATIGEKSPVDEMKDIFDGEVLRGFKGPDGKHFCLGNDEGRYVFSLSVDFFNPLTNKQGGKKVSVGVISLVCLNIPPGLRYKPENIFLAGLIPGPKEPPLDSINHYLTPLIDAFLELWTPGVRFSRTYGFPNGRLIRCALIAVICDLPAARKVGGFATFSHEHFCSICHCTRKKEGYGDVDYNGWRRRTADECRAGAEQYKAAENEKQQKAIFDSAGLRWSELLRLPYFDPVRFIVVDAMHNLFLGLVKEHFDGILGLRLNKDEPERVLEIKLSNTWMDFSEKEQKSVKRLTKWLEAPLDYEDQPNWRKRLGRCHARALQFLCTELRCPLLPLENPKARRTVARMVNELIAWRETQPENRAPNAETSTTAGFVFSVEEVEIIQADIQNLITPSWLTSVPANLGSANHGKLKADQYRVLGTVHLPISLIHLWSKTTVGDARSERCRKILDMTISLLSAVTIASSRTTSRATAGLYLQHMQSYLEGIKTLFPEYRFHANHHMAMHLYEYLIHYGPVHAWWTFPFERVIGMLQRIPTNYKPGQYEATIAESFTRAGNLRGIMGRIDCPEALQNCRSAFTNFLNPQVRDTLITDMLSLSSLNEDVKMRSLDDSDSDFDDELGNEPLAKSLTNRASPIPPDLFETLRRTLDFAPPHRAHFLSNLTINGIVYSTSSKHLGNACVLIKTAGAEPVAARIEHILQLETSGSFKTYIAIRRHESSWVGEDPFLRYPMLRARIWSETLSAYEIIIVDKIHAHFAKLSLTMDNTKVAVVVSLFRGHA